MSSNNQRPIQTKGKRRHPSIITLTLLASHPNPTASFLQPSAITHHGSALHVASPYFTVTSASLPKKCISYSRLNHDESASSQPLTVVPIEFEKKIASFSSNVGRLRVEKRRFEEEQSKDDDDCSTLAGKHIDDAIISTCNSFVYFLNDESSKLSSFTGGDAVVIEDTIEDMRTYLEMAFVQSIRGAADVGDFVLISKIVHGAVGYARSFIHAYSSTTLDTNNSSSDNDEKMNSLALLPPRIFGEAITSLSKTKASISKIKGMWNYLINDVANMYPHVLTKPPSAYELNAVVSALGSRKKIRAAVSLYNTTVVVEKRIEADAYTASILFGMLADSIVSCDTTAIIGDGNNDGDLTRHDDKKSPCRQWNEALELLDTFTPRQLNNVAYSSLLKVNERATEMYIRQTVKHDGVSSAMGVLDRMKRDGISPDVTTCSVIMSTFDKGRNWKAAISLLDTMRKSSKGNNGSVWTLPPPNIYTYALAISTCARCDKKQEVLRLFDQMSISQRKNPKEAIAPYTWVYNAALEACAESCHSSLIRSNRGVHLATAMTILEKMEGDSTDIEDGEKSAPDTDSYNSVLAMLGQRILSDAKKIKVKTSNNGGEARRLTEYTRNSDIVDDILKTMTGRGIRRDAVTYSNAVAACFSQPEQIVALFRKAVDELRGDLGAGNEIREVANAALTAAASLGDMGVVSDVIKILSGARVKMNIESIRQIILALGKSGDCEGILALLICLREQDFANEMLMDRYGIDILGNLPSRFLPVLNEKVYSAAITSCLKNDELAIADQVLQSMKVKGISLTQTSLNDVVMEYCRMALESSKEEYKAARIAKRNEPASKYPDLLEPIYITSHARSKAALAVLKAVNKPSRKLLAAVTKACAASGLWQESRSMLRRMHRAAIQELRKPGPSGDATAFADLPKLHRYLLKFCAKGGHITPALNYADDIQYLAQQVRVHRKSLLADKKNSTGTDKVSISSILLSDKPKKQKKQQTRSESHVPEVLGRPIGLTGPDWKLLLISAWRGGHWKVCVGTLPYIQPYVKETHPKHSKELSKEQDETGIRKPSLKTLDRKYAKLESAITAAVLCFEVRSQYAWAIRAIEDWIEWSGRRPPRQAVIAACRVLAKRYRGTEVVNLVGKVLNINDANNMTKTDPSEYTYEKAIYVESITALHQSGLYDDADHLFAEGVRNGHLPSAVIEDALAQELKLDLHGMSAAVAHASVRVSIQQEMTKLQSSSTSPHKISWSKDLIIITGRGLRSGQRFKPVLRPEVQRMLTEEFFPPLGSSTIPGNLGALTVSSEDVSAWLSNQQQQKSANMLMIADKLRDISSGARLERAILSSGNRLEQALKRKLESSNQTKEDL